LGQDLEIGACLTKEPNMFIKIVLTYIYETLKDQEFKG